MIPNPVWKLLPAELTGCSKISAGHSQPCIRSVAAQWVTRALPVSSTTLAAVFSSSSSNAVHEWSRCSRRFDHSDRPRHESVAHDLRVALRAAEVLADPVGLCRWASANARRTSYRPEFRSTDAPAQPPATEVEIIERLVGPVISNRAAARQRRASLKLTLRFSPTALAQLNARNGGNPTVPVAANMSEFTVRSRIRIFPRTEWDLLEMGWTPPRLMEQKLDAIADFKRSAYRQPANLRAPE